LDRRNALEGLRVAIIGDIAHSRVARSNVHLLSKFGDIVLCGPPPFCRQSCPDRRRRHLTNDIREAIAGADVIMMLRVQLARQHDPPLSAGEYFQFYGLRSAHGPRQTRRYRHASRPINRGRELSSEVADFKVGDSQSRENGVPAWRCSSACGRTGEWRTLRNGRTI
jgi:aspartate carbamoyltransferase catalytic subunit